MALSKAKKNQVIDQVGKLLDSSKLTVVSKYEGTTVKALQQLRRQARDGGTSIRVVKNRLFIKAMKANNKLKGIDTSALNGMLLYAFNPEDEAAPAQIIDSFAKENPGLEFAGAITADGKFMPAEDVAILAKLPKKEILIADIVALLLSPLSDIATGLDGNLHGLLDAIGSQTPNA